MVLDPQALVGSTGRASLIVGEADTAIAARSGDLPVLATPRLVALMEEAACAAVASALDGGSTSVGTHIEVDHLLPSRVGARVTATATVRAVDGRRIHLDVIAQHDTTAGTVDIGRGHHTRVVVDRERFLSRP